jgi:hypothetical protein
VRWPVEALAADALTALFLLRFDHVWTLGICSQNFQMRKWRVGYSLLHKSGKWLSRTKRKVRLDKFSESIVFPLIIWFYDSANVIIRDWGCGFDNRREDIVAWSDNRASFTVLGFMAVVAYCRDI